MVERVVRQTLGIMGDIATVLIISVLLIILGLIYFMINLAIIKYGSAFLGYVPSSDWAVFSAVLLTMAGLVGSAAKRRRD